ncbi:MAG: NAD(P)-dependent oxidoreductase [Bacteroidetes bacterium]|nr:NAD(P)-dependent oxidoreductase [Bacteroidota bacterium]
MKIALVGATGFVGTAVLNEALYRGHKVTAIARNTEKLGHGNENLTVKQADAYNSDELAAVIAGNDAVISTFNSGWGNPNIYEDFIRGSESIQAAAKKTGIKRLLVVGGAGSLEIKPGVQLVDTPEFPAEWKRGAQAARDYLNIIKKENDLDWTFLSPAIIIQHNSNSRPFRLGTDQPVFDADGKSEISVADLAKALVDELENGRFIKKRFTLGY